MWFANLLLPAIFATKCAWNYRFDENDNHFNIVYPDKNAVYFGMILPKNATEIVIESESHPFATYFSIQIYEYGDFVNSVFHYTDIDIVANLRDVHGSYTITSQLEQNKLYFALFRIYGRGKPTVFPLLERTRSYAPTAQDTPFPSRGLDGRNLFTTIGKGGRRGENRRFAPTLVWHPTSHIHR